MKQPKGQPSAPATQSLPQPPWQAKHPDMRPEADFQAQIEESALVQAQLTSDLLARQMQAQDRQMHAEESARDSNAELLAVRHQLEQSRAEASELREMNHSRDRSIKSPPQSGGFFSSDGYVHNTPGTVQYSTLNVGPPGIGPSPLPSPTDNCPTINTAFPTPPQFPQIGRGG